MPLVQMSQVRPSQGGDGIVNGKSWAEAAIREIVDAKGANWRARVEAIRIEAAQRVGLDDGDRGRISDDDYMAVEEAALGRLERTAKAHLEHIAETPAIKLAQRTRLLDLETLRARRARWPVLNKLIRLPAELLAGLSGAQITALKPVIDLCYSSGSCALSIDAICERAEVSPRSVAYSISEAVRRGYIHRERRQRQSSVLTVIHPRINEWFDWLRDINRKAKNEKKEEVLYGHLSPANLCNRENIAEDRPGRASNETGSEVAKNVEPPRETKSGDPGGIVPLGPLSAWLDRLDAEVAAEGARREAELRKRDESDEPGS